VVIALCIGSTGTAVYIRCWATTRGRVAGEVVRAVLAIVAAAGLADAHPPAARVVHRARIAVVAVGTIAAQLADAHPPLAGVVHRARIAVVAAGARQRVVCALVVCVFVTDVVGARVLIVTFGVFLATVRTTLEHTR